MTAIDTGLLLLRVGLALILFAHATQKPLGWFQGAGPVNTAALFEKMGQRPGTVMVLLAAACELACAISLLLGLLVPLGVAVGIGTMLVAGASLSRWKKTFWNAPGGGGEYPFVLALAIAALGFTGPGAISIDAQLSLPLAEQPLLVGAGAVLLGVLAALPPILRANPETAAA